MWAVLWNLWFWDKQVLVTDKLSFSWATSHVDEWDKHPIYHNAGVVGDLDGLFYKGKYQLATPYDIVEDDFKKNFCSYNYAQEIIKTKEVTCLK
jgi:hypothetical protein